MVIVDQLYGAVPIPDWLVPVLFSPEVQRLRGVRLTNTATPSLPSLSDVRRYAHTIGVLRLGLEIHSALQDAQTTLIANTFLAACVLHDIATPPFGHVFEYLLESLNGWNHESFISNVIEGRSRPEGRYHQIYEGNPIKLHAIIPGLPLQADLLASFVRGNALGGQLLAGGFDLDNFDNVYRMAFNLGMAPDVAGPLKLAASIRFRNDAVYFDSSGVSAIKEWVTLRRRAYEVLLFDRTYLSGQAMLTECLSRALVDNFLGQEDWYLNDDDLLRKLRQFDGTKAIVTRFAVADLFTPLWIGWYDTQDTPLDLRHPTLRKEMTDTLNASVGIPCCPLILYDRGTFSKNLSIPIGYGSECDIVRFSKRSQSVIAAVFTPRRLSDTEARKHSARIREVLKGFSLLPETLRTIPRIESTYDLPGQTALHF